MNNKIKFRAWDKISHSFLDENDNTFNFLRLVPYSSTGQFIHMYMTIESSNVHETDLVLQLFTGLLDKNRKEIYEGDIVRCRVKDNKDKRKYSENFISDIFWDYCGWSVHESNACDDSLGRYENLHNQFPITTIKVIGNIYETPELLK